jgi:hypothetical protein
VTIAGPTGIEDVQRVEPPIAFVLHSNRPNPFNPRTTITYEISERTHVILTVYNLLGQEIAKLVDDERMPGRYTVVWDNASNVASGIYLYRLTTSAGFSDTKRMTLLKKGIA